MTGGAGQIGYALVPLIANGDMLGKDRRVILQLLDLPMAMDALKGVAMELRDCAFPCVAGANLRVGGPWAPLCPDLAACGPCRHHRDRRPGRGVQGR